MTAYDLTAKSYEKPIIEEGSLSHDYNGNIVWGINTSSILTELIQQTGRFAERFASDLFIDWQSVNAWIGSGCEENKTWFFGIRESGVDHEAFITSRMESCGRYWQHNYRKIFRLDATIEERSYGLYAIMTLQEMSL